MISLLALALAALQTQDKGVFFEKDTLKKPSFAGTVARRVPRSSYYDAGIPLTVKLPGTARQAKDATLFIGPDDGRLSLIVEVAGKEARAPVLEFILNVEIAYEKGKLPAGVFVAKPWVGTQQAHKFQTDKTRAGQLFMMFYLDEPYIKGSMMASWPVGNAKAKAEAISYAHYAIWSARPSK